MTKDEALKMAILLLECPHITEGRINVIVDACKEALEQPAQEPMAWRNPNDDDRRHAFMWHGKPRNEKQFSIPLYTHPHQWQGLTDDEALQIYINDPAIASYDDPHLIKYARAIEQALKEKNYG
jgi:hypothetical protein